VLNLIQRGTDKFSDGFFAVARKHVIEVLVYGGSQSAVVPGPQFRNARFARLFCHLQNVIGLFEIKREADGIPSLLEVLPILRLGGVFQDGDARDILAQKAQAERDAPRHAEAPTKITRRILAKVVV
jgi:hypothetical protein